MSALMIMPTSPITHAPSFHPTIYPFQLTLTLSTSTPPSTLTLPRYKREANPQTSDVCPESNQFSEDIEVGCDSRKHPRISEAG
jgi:hypothetical protein